jgi:hypothetical protein
MATGLGGGGVYISQGAQTGLRPAVGRSVRAHLIELRGGGGSNYFPKVQIREPSAV